MDRAVPLGLGPRLRGRIRCRGLLPVPDIGRADRRRVDAGRRVCRRDVRLLQLPRPHLRCGADRRLRLLGAGCLIWKTDGATQVFARKVARAALILTAATMLLVSAWRPLGGREVGGGLFAWPSIALLASVAVVTAALLLKIWRRLWAGRGTDTSSWPSPSCSWVANLAAQLGDYANVGEEEIS